MPVFRSPRPRGGWLMPERSIVRWPLPTASCAVTARTETGAAGRGRRVGVPFEARTPGHVSERPELVHSRLGPRRHRCQHTGPAPASTRGLLPPPPERSHKPPVIARPPHEAWINKPNQSPELSQTARFIPSSGTRRKFCRGSEETLFRHCPDVAGGDAAAWCHPASQRIHPPEMLDGLPP